MSLKMTGSFAPITGATKLGDDTSSPALSSYEYLTQFDTAANVANHLGGSYSLGDTRVTGMSLGDPTRNSAQTFRNVAPTEEIRFRFQITTGSAGHVILVDDDGKVLCTFFDHDNKIRWTPASGVGQNASTGIEDSGLPMEFRINTLTGEITCFRNDIQFFNDFGYVTLSSTYYAYVRENSSGACTVTILPDPN